MNAALTIFGIKAASACAVRPSGACWYYTVQFLVAGVGGLVDLMDHSQLIGSTADMGVNPPNVICTGQPNCYQLGRNNRAVKNRDVLSCSPEV